MRIDPLMLTQAADRFLARSEHPRQRAIVANYRLHAMLEVCGRWPEIFTPALTVEQPFYRVATPAGVLELDGAAQVQTFYQGLQHTEATVMVLEGEELRVDDSGFASEALYHTFMGGATAQLRGHADADPARRYVESRWVCMTWPYDERARMIGERVYPAPTATLRECAEADFLTLAAVNQAFGERIAQAQAALAAGG